MKTACLVGRLVIWIVLALSLASPAQAGALPPRASIQGFKGNAQSANLSCEARSAVDWAAYWGVRIGEKKFLARLPRSSNPDEGFVGNPNDAWGNIPPASYGVYAAPVAELLRKLGLDANARRNLDWDDLRGEIAAGRPVIVWVVGQMWKGMPLKYVSPDGHKTTVARYEHTMVLTGYEPGKVQVMDAYTGERQTYPLSTFLASWGTLGRMAVMGGGRVKPQPTQTPAAGAKVEESMQIYLPYLPNGAGASAEMVNPDRFNWR